MNPKIGKLRNTLLLTLVVALLSFACSGYGAPTLPAVIGSWNLTIETPLGTQEPTLVVRGDASGLTATMTSPQGDVEGTDVSWNDDGTLGFTAEVEAGGQQVRMVFTGTVDGDTMTGVFATDFGDMATTGTRVVE